MLEKLKSDFQDILDLVSKAPAPLQETALKQILEHWFAANSVPRASAGTPAAHAGALGAGVGVPDAIKPFLTANALMVETLEKALHPLGPGAQLLVATIPGESKSQQLINLSLLLGVKQCLETGTFTCTLKALRELAVHYNCYDSANFAKTLKNGKNNFKPRGKGEDLELSGPGMKRAADLIKSIATVA